jgi:TonB-dependent starch-binding outer membrane protein SusC
MSIKKLLQCLVVLIATFVTMNVSAQTGAITGTVLDDGGAAIVGATVTIKGSNSSVRTNANGKFSINAKSQADYVIISAPGMASKTIPVSSNELGEITLNQKSRSLTDVVVVGYGSTKQKDVTGSIASVKSKDFNQGVNGTPEQLIIGKVAGVQITTAGGAPGSGSRIRIRGGSSLNASNDPLIVIDGVPIDNYKMGGSANPLNMINPNDIETFDILKDASATAIYGSRASNGVIIITTKRGTKKDDLHVSFSTMNSLATATERRVDMLNATEYRNLFALTQKEASFATLGNADNNWQNLLLRDAYASDNNVSITGGIKGLPYRVSLGYMGQQGMVIGGGIDRGSFGVNISPTFFNNTLKINAGVKSSTTLSKFTDEGAIGTALSFDPTQSVGSENEKFGNYFAWTDAFGNPIPIASSNPLAMVNLRDDRSTTKRTLANIQIDYKIPFISGLRANLNLASDNASSDGMKVIPYASATGDGFKRGGKKQGYGENRTNKLMEVYLNYNKELKKDKLTMDLTAGHSYQDLYKNYPTFTDYTNLGKFQTINHIDSVSIKAGNRFATQNTLISFFGRANFTIYKNFLLTASLRNDLTSRFAPENRSGVFPAVAGAWRIKETFFKDNKDISNLKLRLGWGQTGQQEFYLNDRPVDYAYILKYSQSDPDANYILGDSAVPALRPDPIDPKIKWETTTTTNLGLDYGFYKNRISGSIDVYNRQTTDLIVNALVPAGSLVGNKAYTNVGSLENKGIEFTLNAIPVATKNFTWDINFNYTHNRNKILSISPVKGSESNLIQIGGIDGGTGNNIQVLMEGQSTNTFFVYQQIYDQNNKPLEGMYVDQNKDNKIGKEDLIPFKSGEPTDFYGFSSNLAFRRMSLGFVLRAQTGGYAYNNVAANLGSLATMNNSVGYNNNIHGSYFDTRFEKQQFLSNYYVENASFLRMDNINIGYNFGNIFKGKTANVGNLRGTFMVQNVFIITKYSGIDPEVVKDGLGGIDKNIYPRARTYSIGLNLDL